MKYITEKMNACFLRLESQLKKVKNLKLQIILMQQMYYQAIVLKYLSNQQLIQSRRVSNANTSV